MEKDLKLHKVQTHILKILMFKPQARFADLNYLKLSTDHFAFHVKSLLEAELIVKSSEGLYSLTNTGKEFANRFDMDSQNIAVERQAKIGVLICCLEQTGSQTRYLVQQRLKQPYFGFYGFLTGKAKWGETIIETAKRELEEETGLSGSLKLVGVKHKMDYSKENELLEDKHFFVFRVDDTKGGLLKDFKGGKNIWLTEEKILALPDLFDGVKETIDMVQANKLIFSETKYVVKGY